MSIRAILFRVLLALAHDVVASAVAMVPETSAYT
jgi:hypothetical protein